MDDLKIISAFYDKLDVTDIVNRQIVEGKLKINVDNSFFGDPNVGHQKQIHVKYKLNGIDDEITVRENHILRLPNTVEDKEILSLVLTSCNRTKQVMLALILNSYIIERKFTAVIVDNSTPHLKFDDAYKMHTSDDPYNLINSQNYSNDIDVFEGNVQHVRNLDHFKLVHLRPRLDKQRGDATLTALGLAQASLLGDGQFFNTEVFALKLTGVCILKEDILSSLPHILKDKDVLTYLRTGLEDHAYDGQRSTRIFGCRAKPVSKLLIEEGWDGWVETHTYLEQKFADSLIKHIPNRINFTNTNESGVILDEGQGIPSDIMRERIIKHIDFFGVPKEIPLVKEFLSGGIY
jgi:hypothetical protein